MEQTNPAGRVEPAATTPGSPGNASAPRTTQPAAPVATEQDLAVEAAKADARSKNPGLGELDVTSARVAGTWAIVRLQPKDRSTDAAAWLLRKNGTRWVVVDFGTTIIPEDYPDAPREIFQ